MSKLTDDAEKVGSIFVYSAEMARFDFGPGHPYKSERAGKTYDLCTRYGVMKQPWKQVLDPKPIDKSLLTRFMPPSPT